MSRQASEAAREALEAVSASSAASAAISAAASSAAPPSAKPIDPEALAAVSADLASVIAAVRQLDAKVESLKEGRSRGESPAAADGRDLDLSGSGSAARLLEASEEQRQQRAMLSQLQSTLDGLQAAVSDMASRQMAASVVAADAATSNVTAVRTLVPNPSSDPPRFGSEQDHSISNEAVPAGLSPPTHQETLVGGGEDSPASAATDSFRHSTLSDALRSDVDSIVVPGPSAALAEDGEKAISPERYDVQLQPDANRDFQGMAAPDLQQQQQQQQQQQESQAAGQVSSPYLPRADVWGMGLSEMVFEALRLLRLGREEARLGQVRRVAGCEHGKGLGDDGTRSVGMFLPFRGNSFSSSHIHSTHTRTSQDLGMADQALRGSITVLQEALKVAPSDPKVGGPRGCGRIGYVARDKV